MLASVDSPFGLDKIKIGVVISLLLWYILAINTINIICYAMLTSYAKFVLITLLV